MSTEGKNNSNIFWQKPKISKDARRRNKGHSSVIIWHTGLPGSGKTTISRELDERLYEVGIHTYLLDGDNVRHGLNKDLSFSREDRKENIRRTGEVARLFMDAGTIVICAFASPYREDRKMVRDMVDENEFIEVFVKCPLTICMQRDPKGLYKKAISGEIKGFTGIDDPYEQPENPEIILETDKLSIDESAVKILTYLKDKGIL